MNRDHIDFTKTGKCCLCGEEKQLSEAEIGRFGGYTACRTLMCQNCAELSGAKEKDGRLFVKDVDGVPKKVAARSARFAAAAKKALAAEWKKRGDLERWIAEPFAVVGGQTFGQVAMKAWTDAKDKAFAVKLAVIDHFKSKRPDLMSCPVCRKPLVVEAPPAEKLEINDVLKFKCPDGCLAFDETELASLYRDSYEDYIRRLGAGYSRYGSCDRLRLEAEKNSVRALSCTAYALDVVEKILTDLACERYDVTRDAMHEKGGPCNGCKRGCSSEMSRKCHGDFAAAHPELFSRIVDHIYGFKKGMNLRGLLTVLKESNEYKASEHCKLWCDTSPDNAAHGVCGATSRRCERFDGEKSCRKCGMHVEGRPLGNFLATAGMCQHYQEGKCLAHRGKDGKWEGREDLDVCTFKAGHYVFSDKGRFCESFRLRDGLNLDAALEMSKAGKSYSGYYR